MKKQLTALAISVLFLVPGLTYAASVEEQRQAILIQIIHLLEQQISELQAQLATQEAGVGVSAVEEATSTPTCFWQKGEDGHQHRTCGG